MIKKYKYTYKTYGLILKSEVEIEELPLGEEQLDGDVFIGYGKVPRLIKDPIINSDNTKMNKNEAYFYINGVAHFHITNGKTITIEADINSTLEKQKIYILGGALGTILAQRNVVGIHGGTVIVDKDAVILTGRTGAGKSTLLAGMRLNGCKFVADDVSAIGKDMYGNIIVHPAYPRQKLCGDTIKKMGHDLKAFKLIDEVRDKYSIVIDKNFVNNEITLKAIFEIEESELNMVKIEKVSGLNKLKLLMRNIYGIDINKYLGLDPEFIKKILVLASEVSCFKILRPKDKFTVNEQIALIKEVLEVVI